MLLFLVAHGLPVVTIARVKGEVARVTVGGHENLWTVHYMGWINRMWAEWAEHLGFKEPLAALRAGHLNFDPWLQARVE